jgi:hypothetical protein
MYPAGMETNWWVRPATALARVARSLFLDALEGGGKFAPGGSSSAGRVCGLETVSSFQDDGHRRRSGPEVPILDPPAAWRGRYRYRKGIGFC